MGAGYNLGMTLALGVGYYVGMILALIVVVGLYFFVKKKGL